MYQSELIHPVMALAPAADRFNTNPQTDFLSLKDYGTITFVLEIGVGTTGTATITAQQAQDAAGTGPANMPFKYRRVSNTAASDVEGAMTDATSSGFTTTAGSNQLYLIEIDAQELDSDKPFVALTLTEVVNDPVAASVLAILGEARYPGSVSQTAIA